MNIDILFGSEKGQAKSLADQAAVSFTQNGYTVHVRDMAEVSLSELKTFKNILIITSTFGKGGPPTNAIALYKALQTTQEDLSKSSYAVYAIGSSSFPTFCQAGKDFDEYLKKSGAKKLVDIVTAEKEYSSLTVWMETIQQKLS